MTKDGCGVTVVLIGVERYECLPFYGNTGERYPNCSALSGPTIIGDVMQSGFLYMVGSL